MIFRRDLAIGLSGDTSGWYPRSDDERLITLLLVLGLCLTSIHLALSLPSSGRASDFFVFWSVVRIAAELPTERLAELYDPTTLLALQNGLEGASGDIHPFAYPPSALLLLRPLTLLDYDTAKIAWLVLSFAALAIALDGWRHPLRVLALAAAPAFLVNVAFGQNGFWTAAFLAGALLRCRSAPLMAGILLALATVKPQLGLLVPVLLVALGAWRAIGYGVAATGSLVGASLVSHGLAPWIAWLDGLQAFALETVRQIDHLTPHLASATAALLHAGASLETAQMVQLLLGLIMAAAIYRVARQSRLDTSGNPDFGRSLRREVLCDPHEASEFTPVLEPPAPRAHLGSEVSGGVRLQDAVAATLAGTLVATPFAYVYDTVILAVAVVLLTERHLAEGASSSTRMLLILAWLAPFLSKALMPLGVPIVPIAAFGAGGARALSV